MEHDFGETTSVVRRRTDVVIGWVCSAFALAVLVWALTNPYPGSDFTDQIEVMAIGLIVWPGVLASLHPKVELRRGGLVVVN